MRAAFFDGSRNVRAMGFRIDLLDLLKSQVDRAREGLRQNHEAEYEDQFLEAMAHWRYHKPPACVRRCKRRHILDDNPCSG